MKKLNRFYKVLITASAFFVLIFSALWLYLNPPPWKSWRIVDPSKSQSMKVKTYFNTVFWCGNLSYQNDLDCEFGILVLNPESDTLFYEIIKEFPHSNRKVYKGREVYVGLNKNLVIKYIPIDVPKNANIKIDFSCSRDCAY